jgi:hypothetical protein
VGSPKQRALSVKGNLGLSVNVKAREGNTKDRIMQKSSAQMHTEVQNNAKEKKYPQPFLTP